jgi:ABC-type transport system involved in cytochrome c biogenesis permease subunit
MPYVIAIGVALVGLAIIRDVLYALHMHGPGYLTLQSLLTLAFGVFLVWLGWFIFKEILTKTYTLRK